MKNVGLNEVQLSDMTNQFFQVIFKIHGKKSALPLKPKFNLNFLEFFKCNSNSKSVICHKTNFLILTLANFV